MKNSSRRENRPAWIRTISCVLVGLSLAGILVVSISENSAARDGAGQGRVKSGTGFFVSGDGFLVTSAHVVAGCPDISIWPADGAPWTGQLVAVDAGLDIALLSSRDYDPRAPRTVRENSGLRPGESVLTIGFGVLPSRPREPVLTAGALVGQARDDSGHPLLLLKASLREGNSGGPVIDANGMLVGMVTGRDASRPELGVAVPADVIDTFLSRHGIARTPLLPPGDLPTVTADLLKTISVLVQCTPADRTGLPAPQRR